MGIDKCEWRPDEPLGSVRVLDCGRSSVGERCKSLEEYTDSRGYAISGLGHLISGVCFPMICLDRSI